MSKKDKSKPAPKPVEVSAAAHLTYAAKLREWTGTKSASLTFGPTKISPYAEVDLRNNHFTANIDVLLLNPNRVLRTVTPFRLKQEAVLTGALLHEVGHVRHSKWLPHTQEEFDNLTHRDGSKVGKPALQLASLVEEARIEGLMAANADKIGASGLAWTMRASAARLLPLTEMSTDPDQMVMDVITSWVLRAGRQVAFHHRVKNYVVPSWVQDFTTLLHETVVAHLEAKGDTDPTFRATEVSNALAMMVRSDADAGTFMLDMAKAILETLFPETDEDDMPQSGSGSCSMSAAPGQAGEGQSGESGDPGEADGEGDESDEQDSDEGEGQSDGSGPDEDTSEDEAKAAAELADALTDMEIDARAVGAGEQQSEKEQADEQAEQGKATVKSNSAGMGKPDFGGNWRNPAKDERDVQRGAERFLRDLVDPTTSSKVSLSDQPAASVDGAALSAWKAGGSVREPHFFKRTRRVEEPAPPVKVAILVDVSGSMDVLQKPSALLSWALSNAALDLRNFAGRGSQVESTLIHWGSSARVIQPVGHAMPGIREFNCNEGTHAMGEALALVEEQMPGFLDPSDEPNNRLIVQFTDWELSGGPSLDYATKQVSRALEAGVNMLTVMPHAGVGYYNRMQHVLDAAKIKRGKTKVITYDRGNPQAIWDHAAEALS